MNKRLSAVLLFACLAAAPVSAQIAGQPVQVQDPTSLGRKLKVNSDGSINTDSASVPLSVVITGQAKIAVTGTAVQLASHALVNGIVVKAKTSNNVVCGAVGGVSVTNTVDGTGNGYIVCPGEAAAFSVSNSNVVYVNGTAGDIFTLEGN